MLLVDVLVDDQDPGNPTESKRRLGHLFCCPAPRPRVGRYTAPLISFLILLEPARGLDVIDKIRRLFYEKELPVIIQL